MLKKRDYFKEDIYNHGRIGNDLLLLNTGDYWTESEDPHFVDATNVIFFIDGAADISINMHDHHIVAPCMVIFMEGMIVNLKSISDNASYDVIILSKQLTDNVLSESNVSSPLRSAVFQDPVFPLNGHKHIVTSFRYLLENLVNEKENPYRLEAVKHMAQTLFYGFALSRANVVPKQLSRKDSIAEQFCSLVKDNYRKERSVAAYADIMCLTPKYLSQVVKDVTGKAALDWIDDYNIIECKALLKSTDLTIDQISSRMNFISPSLFGKYFKRITGVSPRTYRNSVK